MKLPPLARRTLLAGAATLPLPALAQPAWPTRPIRAIVSFPPGGAIDTTTRLIAPFLSESLGQPIVIENRTGATGTIAGGAVASAAPDGYTLLFDASTHASAPHLVRNLNFSYATAFSPVTQLTSVPLILVAHPSVPANTIAEFLALGRARAAAGQPLVYASSGNGSAAHYAAVLFLQRAGWEATHVPFRGGGPAVQALLSGTVQFHMGTAASSTALVQAGQLKGYAVTTRERIPQLPALPTLNESGMPGYEWTEWGGVFAPAGTPAPILDRLNTVIGQALGQAAVRERLNAIGMLPVASPRAAFATYVREQQELVGRLTREANVTLD
ncbi:Bug family tripartite tricarboxylate transporter substrate binding protein [Sediminicoccus rosea]|uniref:Tripartite tricarboxylate transporter substrate-binding protein n=1 Tax=Sediminicoccus rosea TaxID=1225128 RepID=A0ABZ0PMM3_9PROT|nr:tripartite tricarboxylate transporter substrate-binding protein [Sediminicoccus rosea]WPB86711.1 tripartite tricarboxylate transporter substrate-binding protein [Sediminicoccus rosea]